jgi:hypothetical protein
MKTTNKTWKPICCNCLYESATHGHYPCLIYYWETGLGGEIGYFFRLLCRCFSGGNIECVKFVYSEITKNGIPIIFTISNRKRELTELSFRNSELIKFLLQNDLCEWTLDFVRICMTYGNLETFKFAVENGCPIIDKEVCIWAVLCNRLDFFMYSYEHGAPLSSEIYKQCTDIPHYNCLKYAIDNNCPVGDDVLFDKNYGMFEDGYYDKLYSNKQVDETYMCFELLKQKNIDVNLDDKFVKIIGNTNLKAENIRKVIQDEFGKDIGNIIIRFLKW